MWILGLLLLLIGCSKEAAVPPKEGRGSLTVVVASTPAGRAVTPGDGNLMQGGGMEDLTLVLVNPVGMISEKVQLTGLTGSEQQIRRVTFQNLDIGNYLLYAYANTERTLLSEARTLLATLTVGQTFGAAERDALFTALTGRTTPTMDATHPMLLTAVKEVKIGVGNSSEQVDMLRPLVWFEVRMFNHSDEEMAIQNIAFSNFNPSTGYLLPHNGVLPGTVNYRALPTLAEYTGGAELSVPANTEATIYSVVLFENRASTYTMTLDVGVGSGILSDATAINTSTAYLLRNRSTKRYLVDDGNGRMEVVEELTDALSQEHAMWRFSSTSSGYMTNVATGNRYYQSTTAASSGSNLTFRMNSGYLRIYYSSRYYLYLRDTKGSVSFANVSNTTRDWLLQELNGQTASLTNSQIEVIDPVTAAVTPMREQLRNQHIVVEINAYYNDTSDTFNFRVLPWNEKEEEVEFN